MSIKKKTFIFVMAFIVINILKAFFSLGFEDEYYYTISGYRLFQGDALMFDEINATMFMSIFTFPFIFLHMLINGTTDGIILFMRLSYVFVNSLVAIIFYLRFKKKGKGILQATILFLVLTPYNVEALSYNTLTIHFLLLCICALPDICNPKLHRFIMFGILYSCAVLNNPLLACFYILLLLIFPIVIKRKFNEQTKFYIKNLIMGSLIGISISVFALSLLVFSRTSLLNVISAFPMLVDGSHGNGLIWQFCASCYTGLKYFGITSLFMLTILVVLVVDNNKQRKKNEYQIISFATFVLSTLSMLLFKYNELSIGGYMAITIPLTFLGIVQLLLNKKKDFVLILMFIIAVLDSLALCASSNVGIRSFSNALIISSMATMILLCNTDLFIYKILLNLIFVYCLLFKVFFVYSNTIIDKVYMVNSGPKKYLIDTEEVVNSYYRNQEEIKSLAPYIYNQPVIVIGHDNYDYLYNNVKVNINIAYFSPNNKEEYIGIMKYYLSIHNIDKTFIVLCENKLNLTSKDLLSLNVKLIKKLNNISLISIEK